MPGFTPKDWSDGPEGSTPILADDLDHLGSQYGAAMSDVATDIADPGTPIGSAIADIIADTPPPTVPNASETVRGIAELATAAETVTGTDSTRAVHPAGVRAAIQAIPASAVVPPASETVPGIAELATAAETVTGTDATRATHPAGVKAAIASAVAAIPPGSTAPPASETVPGIAEIATQTETNTGSDDTRTVTPKKLASYGGTKFVQRSAFQTPGQILAGMGANSYAALDTGAAGQVLTADPAEVPFGLKWATPAAGGGGALPGLVPKTPGQVLVPQTSTAAAAGASSHAAGLVHFAPVVVAGAGFTADALTVRISTAEDTIPVRLLMYASDAQGHPATLVATATVITGATAGTVYIAVLDTPVPLTPGVYWLTFRSNGGNTLRPSGYPVTGISTLPMGLGDAMDAGRAPAPRCDVGTYAAPLTTLSAWSYAAPTTAVIPWMGVRAA